MSKIKTRDTIKDIKVFDRAADVGTHNLQASYQYTGVNAWEEQMQTYFTVQNNNDLQESVFREHKDENGKVIGGGGMNVRRNAYLLFYNQTGQKNFTQHPMRAITDENAIPEEAKGDLSLTPAQARETVETLLEGTDMAVQALYLTDDANMGNYDGKSSTAETYVYKVYCVRQTAGVQQSFLRGMAMPIDGSIALSPSWYYECMELLIGDEGVISLSWTSPHRIGDVVVEDAALLSFEEIISIFCRVFPITLDASYSEEIYKAVDIEIDRIVLETQRIIEQNSIENGLLVPVWNFYGVQKNTDVHGVTEIEHNGVFDPLLLLSINAVDGSIIDVHRGY